MKRSQFLTQIKEMSRDELRHRLGEAKEEFFNLRFQKATGNLSNPARIGIVKREIAQLLTLLGNEEE